MFDQNYKNTYLSKNTTINTLYTPTTSILFSSISFIKSISSLRQARSFPSSQQCCYEALRGEYTAPGALNTLVTSVVLYSLTRATLMSPGKGETRAHVCIYICIYIYIYLYICIYMYIYIYICSEFIH